MSQPFIPIPDAEALARLFADSEDAPVILFKHDPFCGISAAAHREMATLARAVNLIDVARQHTLSRDVTERSGVPHESPQVLVLRGGRVTWSASRRAITADAVERALREQSRVSG